MSEEIQVITIDEGAHVVLVGVQGPPGAAGAPGATGATGATGPGVAAGGSTGQYLKKASGTDYDTTWDTVSGMAIGTSISGGATQGSVLFAGPSGVLAQDNTNFFFDDTNNRLGVGTASPAYPLHVKSAGSDLQAMFDANSGTRFSGFYLANNGSYKAQFFYDNTSDLVSYTATGAATWIGFSGGSGGNADHLRIDPNGLVGVNKTSSLGAQLHVASGSSSRKGLIVQAAASQTANLTEWQNSSGTALAYFTSAGRLSGDNGSYLQMFSGTGGSISLFIRPPHVNGNGITIRGLTSQTASLQEWQGSSGAILASITSSGSLLLTAASAATTPCTIKGAAAQSANLTEWQNSSSQVLARIDDNGDLNIYNPSDGLTVMGLTHSGYAGTFYCGYNAATIQTTNGVGNITYNGSHYNSSAFIVHGKLQIQNAGTSYGYGSATDYPFDSNRGSHRITGGSATAATWYANRFGQVTLSGHTSTQTVTDVATVRIDGPTIAGSSQAVTITNNYSLWVAAGSSLLQAGSASDKPLFVRGYASQTANLQEWQNSSATTLSAIDKNGAWVPPSMADGTAANNTVYYSTTAGKLVYKDAGGTVNNLY